MKTNTTTNTEPKPIRRISTTDRSDVMLYENIYWATRDLVEDDTNTSFVLTSLGIALSINAKTNFLGYMFEEVNEPYDDIVKRYYQL